MEPFRLVCPNCTSKIVVRHPQLVGQTLPCPRCQNKILVVAPPPGEAAANPPIPPLASNPPSAAPKKPIADDRLDQAKTGNPAVKGAPAGSPTAKSETAPKSNPQTNAPLAKPNSAAKPAPSPRGPIINSDAITKVDAADWDLGDLQSQLAPSNQPAEPSNSSAPLGGGLDGELPDFTAAEQTGDVPFVPVFNDGLDSVRSQDVLSDSNKPAGLSPATWESQTSQARRQLLLLSVIGITGCLLAVLGFLAFIKFFGKSTEAPIAAVKPGGIAAPNPDPAANPANGNQKANDGTEGKPTHDQASGSGTNQNPENASANGDATTTTSEASDPVDPGMGQNKEPAPLTGDNKPGTARATDDTNVGGVGTGTNMAGNTEQPASESANGPIDENLPDIFKDFQKMFDRSSQGQWDDVGKGERTLDQELAIENADVLLKDEYYPAAIDIPVWTERAKRKLAKVQTKPMSLPRAIDWINQMTGAGISLDWFLLNVARFDLSEETIVFSGEDQTVGGLLETLCQAKGLELIFDNEGFPYLRPNDLLVNEQLKRWNNETEKGLGQSLPSTSQKDIVDLLIQLLEIEGCAFEAGKLQWKDSSNPYAQMQLLASLNSVREARTVPREKFTPGQDPYDFCRPAAWVELHHRLQKTLPSDAVIYEDRPIAEILTRAAKMSENRLLIDWPAAWSHGLHPNRLAVSVLRGRTLEEIGNRYFDDYSVELLPLDSQTAMLTTDQERRSILRVIALRTDQGMSIDEIKMAIRPLVPRGIDQKSRFRMVPLPGDEKIVVVRICPPTVSLLRDSELVRALGVDRPGN